MSCYSTCLGLGKNLTVGKLMHMLCYSTCLGQGENLSFNMISYFLCQLLCLMYFVVLVAFVTYLGVLYSHPFPFFSPTFHSYAVGGMQNSHSLP